MGPLHPRGARGSLSPHDGSQTFAHRLVGDCKCGTGHGAEGSGVVYTRVWRLTHPSGAVVEHHREDLANGEKRIRWAHDGVLGLGGLRATDLALYGTAELRNVKRGSLVVVVEGEKARDALARAGIVAVATVAGAKVTPSEASLKPLLGYAVVLWSDNDADGHDHMRNISERLQAMGHGSVREFDWPDAPEGGDAADFFASGRTLWELRGLFESGHAHGLQPPSDRPAPGPVVVRLDAVSIEEVEWLWHGRVPRGKVTLIVGDPGLGKSFLTLDIVARVSRGLAWPDGGSAPLGDSVILSAEDGLADTIAPRLMVAEADRSRVHALTAVHDERGERAFDLGRDVEQLARVLADLRAAGRLPMLVVIDPITAYLGRDVDSHVAAEVRGALAPLAAFAERERVAVVAVAHLNKAASRALYRVGGSVAFVAAARSVLAVAPASPDPHEPRRALGSLKSNLGPPPATLAFEISAGRVAFEAEPVEMDIAAALRGPNETHQPTPGDEAADFLREVLADHPVPAAEILTLAEGAGVSERTLKRARERVGVRSFREGGLGASGRWVWELTGPNPAKNAAPGSGLLSGSVVPLDGNAPDDVDEVLLAALDVWPHAVVDGGSSDGARAANIVS